MNSNETIKWGKMLITWVSETPEKFCVMTASGALVWLGKCTWKIVDGAIVPIYA
jgi:hypothetical protein